MFEFQVDPCGVSCMIFSALLQSVQNHFLHWCRLREIEMSEHDAEMYQRMLSKVCRQIQTLRIMLDAIKVSLFSHFELLFL